MSKKQAPQQITELKENEIFVFGSNLAGKHSAGAAFQAKKHFGAEIGVGEGLRGQSYAFPTLGRDFEKLSVGHLETSRRILYNTCEANPTMRFLLTKVGCGIAGYEEAEMKALFVEAPANLILPDDWKSEQKWTLLRAHEWTNGGRLESDMARFRSRSAECPRESGRRTQVQSQVRNYPLRRLMAGCR